jgi:hypothetical protein
MMKVRKRKMCAKTHVIVARKKRGLLKGNEIVNQVNGTEMNAG